ncbi:MAG TPA: hypothetical protein PK843_15360 [bacterium]|nr:hypothetical protein [bacterium]HPN35892.1 hypothetical protein [bacterium]
MPRYGDRFREGEVVLIHLNEKPGFYARIEQMLPDRKKGWWQVTFLFLTLPSHSATWILDEDQVRGADFTIQGNPLRIERVASWRETDQRQTGASPTERKSRSESNGNIVSLFEEDD